MENYKKGQKVYFTHKGKIIEAIITRVNQKTISIEAGLLKGRISPSLVSPTPINDISNDIPATISECPKLTRSEYYSQNDLETLTNEVKEEFFVIFLHLFTPEEQELLKTVKVSWGNRYTYRRLGSYQTARYPERNPEKHNIIRISKSLQHTPKEVIKHTLYHELLHIHFHCHGTAFRSDENRYPNIKKTNEYTHKLCREIRDHGIYRIARLPITEKRNF